MNRYGPRQCLPRHACARGECFIDNNECLAISRAPFEAGVGKEKLLPYSTPGNGWGGGGGGHIYHRRQCVTMMLTGTRNSAAARWFGTVSTFIGGSEQLVWARPRD